MTILTSWTGEALDSDQERQRTIEGIQERIVSLTAEALELDRQAELCTDPIAKSNLRGKAAMLRRVAILKETVLVKLERSRPAGA